MKIRLTRRRRPRLARSKPWRFAERAFLVFGLLLLGFAISTYVARYFYQGYQTWKFDRDLSLRRNVPPVPPPPNVAVQTGSLIGKIGIQRLGISAVVKEGVDDATLGLAVGHIPSTALPGQTGNVGVAAHRDTLFRNLKDVKRDDEITVTTLDGEYLYRVDWFHVVNPTDVHVLDSTAGESTLTLVTCYPFYFVGHAPKRFIVRARQVANLSRPAQFQGL
ncbi:MAG: class D sortase [Candidatus Solibacter usitatus]|nr:class D sortase [Candidatus Solibacter usitatus]